MALENPPYEVLEKEDNFELRQYDSYVAAEVTVQGGYDDSLTPGFRILADYIFGNNISAQHIAMTVPVTAQRTDDSEKIAMTAPVTARSHGADSYRIAFMMPSKYTMETLPRPVDTRIEFRLIPRHRSAAVRFSGHLSEETGTQRWTELAQWMQRRGLTPVGLPYCANYSPPWIPPFLRRNEVLVDVFDEPRS